MLRNCQFMHYDLPHTQIRAMHSTWRLSRDYQLTHEKEFEPLQLKSDILPPSATGIYKLF